MPNADNIFLVMEMRRMGIADLKVMEAVEKIPSHLFPEEGFVNELYDPRTKTNQDINRFLAVAILCNSLQIDKKHKVLEIGTGSGYQTSVLAKLCRRVYSISLNKDIIQNADKIISSLNINNFTTMKADVEKGLENQAPFDRIIINQVFFKIPEEIKNQLADDGIIIAPVGFPESEDQVLKKVHFKNGEWLEEDIMQIKFIYP